MSDGAAQRLVKRGASPWAGRGAAEGPWPPGAVRWRVLACALAALAAAGCATEQKIPWSEVVRTSGSGAEPRGVEMGFEARPFPPSPTPPSPQAHPPPGGATLLATADGPAQPTPSRLSAAAAGALEEGFEVVHSLAWEAGQGEIVALARGSGEFKLLTLASTGAVLASRSYRPTVHRNQLCHLELALLGILPGPLGPQAILWEDRGVGCTTWEGGGLERRLLLPPLFEEREEGAALLLGSRRVLGPHAVDVYDGAAWLVEGAAGPRLLVRGVWSARRACGQEDPPFWVGEAVFRTVEGGEVLAWGPRRLPLPGGVLPPELLQSHPAACSRR